jgi:hypothetical protein
MSYSGHGGVLLLRSLLGPIHLRCETPYTSDMRCRNPVFSFGIWNRGPRASSLTSQHQSTGPMWRRTAHLPPFKCERTVDALCGAVSCRRRRRYRRSDAYLEVRVRRDVTTHAAKPNLDWSPCVPFRASPCITVRHRASWYITMRQRASPSLRRPSLRS